MLTWEKNRILREEARLDAGSITSHLLFRVGCRPGRKSYRSIGNTPVQPNPPACVINLVNFAN
jgi:hypothetical protein